MTAKRPAKKAEPAAQARWRTMQGDREIERFESEALARRRWNRLARTVAGYGARLVSADGRDEG